MNFKVLTCLFTVFLGTVFVTSEYFVDEENYPKFLYAILSSLIVVILFLSKKIKDKFHFKILFSENALSIVLFVGVLQALYGLLQYIGIFHSKNSFFSVTGSFENPAGFAALISLVFPIGLYKLIEANRVRRIFYSLIIIIILMSVVASGSRTGILSIILSSIILLTLKLNLFINILKSKYRIVIISIMFITTTILTLGLKELKQDSANGRLLIWKVSCEMIKEKPFFGYGSKGFSSKYMDFQAGYFNKNPKSKYSQLAGNTHHPLNEFIKTTINYGILGLAIHIILLYILIQKSLRSKSKYKSITTSVFIVFIVFSLFSYPMDYVPVWFIVFYFVLLLYTQDFVLLKLSNRIRIGLLIISFISIGYVFRKALIQMKWKNIAIEAIEGNSEQMLPHYANLYPLLRHNPLFIYNYAAELNFVGKYSKSLALIKECEKTYRDYDTQMLLADNYRKLKQTTKALAIYQNVEYMIPSKFLPLDCQLEIQIENNNFREAEELAKEIIGKKVKISSNQISAIINQAKIFLEKRGKVQK